MKNKGFCLLSEVTIFCLVCILLLTAFTTFTRALSYQRQILAMSLAMQAAQQATVDEITDERFVVRKISKQEQNLLEVQVTHEQTTFNLWQALAE